MTVHISQHPDQGAPVPPEPTDEELLRLAASAIEPYESCGIALNEYEAESEAAVEVYGSELIAFARAVLARWGHQPVPPPEGELSDNPPVPISAHDLAIQWNQQADQFNQWDSLDLDEQLGWAQARAIALDRSRRAPQAAEETDPIRQAAEQARQALEGWVNHGEWVWPESALEQAKRDTAEALTALNAALAQPVPPRPTDEEIIAFWSDHCAGDGDAGILRLARWGNTTPQTVPVSERPWERDGWCDEQGRCLWTAGEFKSLPLSWWLVNDPLSCTSGFMLPAHALPIPGDNQQ